MRYTANEYAGMATGAPLAGGAGADWAARPESAAQRAFAVAAAPLASQAAGNQPMGSQGSGQGQPSQPYPSASPAGGIGGGTAGGTNGANRSALGTLIIRPLPAEAGGQTREVVLDGRDVAIGRSPACDIVLEGDQLVSRRHALLRATNGQYTIVDLGSSNGTYINDTEIHQNTVLTDGDLITIGEHEILFSTRPPSGVAPSAPSATASGALGTGQEQRAAPSASPTSPYLGQGTMPASDLFDVSAAQTLLEPSEAQAGWAPSAPAQPPYAVPAQPPQPPAQPAQPPQQAAQEPLQPPQAPAYQPPQYQPQASQPGAPLEPTYGPMRSGSTDNVRNTSAYLRAVRTQLDEANQRLAQAEQEESRLAEQRRAGLIEVRDRLNAILAEQRQAGYGGGYSAGGYGGMSAGAPNVAGLVTLARQTEQNQRQIDYMMQFAAHAGEIASALESAQSGPAPAGGPAQTSQALLAQLEALRARIDELLA